MIYLQSIINGVAVGSLYALVGLAAMFVLRVTGIINFSVGGIVVLGGLLATSMGGVWPPLVILVMLVFGAGAGIATHLLSTQWLTRGDQFSGVLVTVAFVTALQGLAYYIYGSDLRFARPLIARHSYQLGSGLTIDTGTILLISTVFAGYMICWLILDNSHLGRSLRAVSDDPTATRLTGLSTVVLGISAYAILGMLCFFVGDIYAQVVGVSGDSMFPILVGALFGLVLGGSAKVLGPLVGGLLLGVAQSVANARLSQFWGTVVELAIVLVILYVAPGGLFPDRRSRAVG